MKVLKTKFKDLLVIKKDTYFDNRGYFRELYLNKLLKKKFVFDVLSLSKKMYYEVSIYKLKSLREN